MSAESKRLKHGHCRANRTSRTWMSWRGMIQRCSDPGHVAWSRYGGRGITVCDEWRDFKNFLADMGERPPGKTLDRYPNNDGNYGPGNCRWASPAEQGESHAAKVAFGERLLTLKQLATTCGIRYETIRKRFHRGQRGESLWQAVQ